VALPLPLTLPLALPLPDDFFCWVVLSDRVRSPSTVASPRIGPRWLTSTSLAAIVRSWYLPRPKSQPQCARRDWEHFFHLVYTGQSGWTVENRDTAEFGNGFFEQLEPLPA
jgi:hypothetical protein